MDVLSHICAALGLAAFLAVEVVDFRVSMTYPMWTEREGGKLAQDRTGRDAGYFEPWRSVLITAGGVVAAVLLWTLLSPWAPAILMSILALGIWLQGVQENLEEMRDKREVQFSILRVIRQAPALYKAPITPEHSFDGQPMWYVAPHFWDVRIPALAPFVDEAERTRARDELSAKMRRLAAKPESEWWKVTRSRDI